MIFMGTEIFEKDDINLFEKFNLNFGFFLILVKKKKTLVENSKSKLGALFFNRL